MESESKIRGAFSFFIHSHDIQSAGLDRLRQRRDQPERQLGLLATVTDHNPGETVQAIRQLIDLLGTIVQIDEQNPGDVVVTTRLTNPLENTLLDLELRADTESASSAARELPEEAA